MTPYALLPLMWAMPLVATAAPNAVSAEEVQPSSAADTLASAVEAAGLQDPKGLELRFVFRGTSYRLWLDGTRAIYLRDVPSSDGQVRTDRLEGESLTATLGGAPLPLTTPQSGGLRRSLNSVAYFALLPRPLLDDAVLARSLGTTALGGERWHTVEVRFREDGGGDDHDDVFRYWIHPETHRIGYLAYTFATGEGGVRVRRATDYHEVDGVVLIDWANHGRDGQGLGIDAAIRELEAGTLPQLSTIELEQVQVQRGVPPPAGR